MRNIITSQAPPTESGQVVSYPGGVGLVGVGAVGVDLCGEHVGHRGHVAPAPITHSSPLRVSSAVLHPPGDLLRAPQHPEVDIVPAPLRRGWAGVSVHQNHVHLDTGQE